MNAGTIPALRVQDLSWGVPAAVKAGEKPIFEGLDFELEVGSWVVLTGPSGVGKTTLLSLVAGLMSPMSGEVELFGRQLRGLSDAEVSEIRQASIGLMFQNFHLDDSRSTLENILLPGYFCDRPWHELKERARELGTKLGLENKLDGPVSVLSGGQRQRVALARALVLSPKLLLADEPTGALDEATTKLVLDLLDGEVEAGMSLLAVTHDRFVLERAAIQLRLTENGLERIELS